ncbi:MAG TPA: helix-turn-helix transcriptional regulator [Saprospiraceae bacterium]|nr:helix-turn-helix transcriptional regulator [Saprospiraceae bacterium]
MKDIIKIESISMFHSLLQMPPPKHPLISVIDLSKLNDMEQIAEHAGLKVASSFYAITLKHLKAGSLQYGRKQIDFQEGSLFFSSPDQVGVLQNPVFEECSYNWGVFFHTDLLYGTPLASKIANYSFFRYAANEALHLSEDEKKSLSDIIITIQAELNRAIDKHTKNVFVSAIELLLNHCNRYYDRQFITRENQNKTVVETISNFLSNYFVSSNLSVKGLPTALQCAEHVNLSPNYLSDLLRKETGKTTQEHIHYHLLEIAKDRLLGSDDLVKEIAHSLGFEHPQYFSSLFKKKVGVSPSEFRSMN